jgi:hypothetical protein
VTRARITLGCFVLATLSTFAASAELVGCSHHAASSGAGTGAGAGAGGAGAGGDVVRFEDAGADVAAGPHATVRVADFSRPDLLYLDVCFSTDPLGPTASFLGPMLRGTYASLSTSTLSPYFDVPAGTRSVRFVLEDSPDCGQTLAGFPDFALAAPLADGERATLVLGGTGYDAGTRGLSLARLDDESVPADGGNSVRFVNVAQAEQAIDLYAFPGFGKTSPCTLLGANIPYASAAALQTLPGGGGPTDANGYAPLRGQNLYQLTFASLGFVATGAACAGADVLYTTDGVLAQGAWTIFFEDEGSTHILCRDDGTPNPFCTTH